MGGILAVVVAVVECSAVAGAAGVGTFAVVLYLSPNFEFSFATSATEYAMTMSPHLPSIDAFSAVVEPDFDSDRWHST